MKPEQYHGGTNFEHTAGGPFIATSYDYDAPIDEYGRKGNKHKDTQCNYKKNILSICLFKGC